MPSRHSSRSASRRRSPTRRRRSPSTRPHRRFRSAGTQVMQIQKVLRSLAATSQVNPALTSLQILQAVKPLVIRQLQAESAPDEKVARMTEALNKFEAHLNARSTQYMQNLAQRAAVMYGMYNVGLMGQRLGTLDYFQLRVYAYPQLYVLAILEMMYDAGFLDISLLPTAFMFVGRTIARGVTDYIVPYVQQAYSQLTSYLTLPSLYPTASLAASLSLMPYTPSL